MVTLRFIIPKYTRLKAMAYYQDLEPFDGMSEFDLTAVGWLSPLAPFPTGQCLLGFLDKLAALQANAVQAPANYIGMGRHHCLFCPGKIVTEELVAGMKIKVGRKNLFIPSRDSRVYISPSLLVHYVKVHGYTPPIEFQEAVLNCPPMRTREYYRKMKSRKADIWSLWKFLKTAQFG